MHPPKSPSVSDQSRCARMAFTTSPHTTALPMDTTGPSGLTAAYSSEPALGSTAPTNSAATLITASIHIMVTLVRIRNVEIRPSITSAETRCVMDAATQAAADMRAADMQAAEVIA